MKAVKNLFLKTTSYIAALALIMPSGLQPKAVLSQTFTVNSTVDAVDNNPGDGLCETATGNGECTLRAAIQETNALDGADTIMLPTGVYMLTITGSGEDSGGTGDLDITDDLTITSDDLTNSIVDGNQIDRIFHFPGNVTAIVNIHGVTLQNGKSEYSDSYNGGAIDNYNSDVTLVKTTLRGNSAFRCGGIRNVMGTVTINDSTIIENNALDYGGGVCSSEGGTLNIDNSDIIANRAGNEGGGLWSSDTLLTLTNSTVRGNSAGGCGGIRNFIGTMTINNSTILENISLGNGGGICSSEGGIVNIDRSDISANRAGYEGGGLWSSDTLLTLTNSTVGENAARNGGGLALYGPAVIRNSTINLNVATEAGFGAGGGILAGGTNLGPGYEALEIINSTLSGNIAYLGGAIFLINRTAKLTNTTISDNEAEFGGGIWAPLDTITLLNTIVANSLSGGNCYGDPIVSLGHNLDSGTTCQFSGPGDLVNTDPMLGPLVDNGGATFTRALLPNSPAIDAGDNVECPVTDQRDWPRPVDGDGDGNATCDIGAYEANFEQRFTLFSITPDRGGNSGLVTMSLYGEGFREGAIVRLIQPGQQDIVGQTVSVSLDGRIMTTTFDLTSTTPGTWDLIVTNSDGNSLTRNAAFEIVNGGVGYLTLDLIGQTTPRVGRPVRYYAVIKNEGLIDLNNVTVSLAGQVSASSLQASQATQLLSQEFSLLVRLPPDARITVPIELVFPPGSCPSSVVANAKAFPENIDDLDCFQLLLLQAEVEEEIRDIQAALNKIDELLQKYQDRLDELELRFSELNCSNPSPENISECDQIQAEIAELNEIISELKNLKEIFEDELVELFIYLQKVKDKIKEKCSNAPSVSTLPKSGEPIVELAQSVSVIQKAKETLTVCPVIPSDPNDKNGLMGFGDIKYIQGDISLLPYTVFFENLASATADATEVLITDQLDSNLDWSTFSLDTFRIGEQTVEVPEGTQNYSTTLDLRPTIPALVEVDMKFNPSTGYVEWLFRGKDPDTGELTGFLPPNTTDVSPRGEGAVSYHVKPKSNLPTGTVIRNKATIDFEVGIPPEPLDTPEVFNTIDSDLPTSEVVPLAPTQGTSNFEVQWSGEDVGSGIRDYTIFVSEDDGPYTIWLRDTTNVAAIFAGQIGKKYSFFSVARDQTGNIEFVPSFPDATTMVAINQPPSLSVSGAQSVQYSDLIGFDVFATDPNDPNNTLTFSATGLPNDLTLTDNGDGTATISGIANVAPATYAALITVTDPGGLSDTKPVNIVVTKEDARTTYTGPMLISTSCVNCTSASIPLRATIQDITAVLGDSAFDPDAGNITNAVVSFVDRKNNAVLCTASVILLDPADPRVGSATCQWITDIGSNSHMDYIIGIVVNGYYTRNSPEDDVVTVVSKPASNFVTGGGYFINQNSGGTYAGDVGLKTNFGLTIKFNPKLTNPQGQVTIIVRRGGHVYQIKSNALSSLMCTPYSLANPKSGVAELIGKANITDVTEPSNPIAVVGNATLSVVMKDNGEPGSTDLIGISLWGEDGKLLYSSSWDGKQTVKVTLNGGNLNVK